MTEHMSAWLGAYHDGELGGRRLRQVETHVADCASCRAELDGLRALTTLLQESPAAEVLMSPERFVAQVGLRLPRRPVQPAWRRALGLSWGLAPVGLLGAWAFIQAVIIVSGMVLTGLNLGLVGDVTAALVPASQPGLWLVEIFSLVDGNLSGGPQFVLDLLGTGAGITWMRILSLVVSTVFGLLLWSWLASWWARRQHGPGAVRAQLASVEQQ